MACLMIIKLVSIGLSQSLAFFTADSLETDFSDCVVPEIILSLTRQTNFGGASSLSQVRLRNFGCISPHLPRFQVIEIEAF